jgi:hypothetical protein
VRRWRSPRTIEGSATAVSASEANKIQTKSSLWDNTSAK